MRHGLESHRYPPIKGLFNLDINVFLVVSDGV